ncbi:hypothetical protein DPV78_012409 [Talaromyces pinophilus]|nr:hypothetical protein DPV78_012409 [Talaromyces pinophilus]
MSKSGFSSRILKDFHPNHKALEFREQLYGYADKLNSFNLVSTLDRAQYTINESIVVPVTDFLRKKGVDLAGRSEVVDLFMTSDNNPAAVTGIEVIQDNTLKSIMVNESDVIIVSQPWLHESRHYYWQQ